MLANFDVTSHQYGIMLLLGEAGAKHRRSIRDVLGIDPRNLVPVLDVLEERHVVNRRVDLHDWRRRTVALTAAGHQLADALAASARSLEQEFLAGLIDDEQIELNRLLDALKGSRRRAADGR